MNPWTIHCLSVFLLAMAPKRKRAPKKESSLKKQKSVVVKQNVQQNANPKITINLAPSRRKSRTTPRPPVLQSRQQQQPNPSQVNVAPVINISLADVLSNQRTPGIQPSSSQISTARTATGGNVYRSALFQERPMPTRQNLTEKIIQTDELNVKDAPGLEIPSNVSVQPGDNSSQLIQKMYTPDNIEEEDFVDNIGDDEYKDAVDFSKTTTQKVFRDIDNAKIKNKDPTGTYENFSDDEYGDAVDFSETTTFQEALIDIDNAKKKKNKIQNNNGNGNEVVAVINGKNLTKDEYFDGGPSQQTDGTETNVTDVTSQTTVDLALQTLTDIIEKLGNKVVNTIKGPPIAVVNFLKEKENRDLIISILRESNKFSSEVINEGFNFFDNFIKRTQKSVGVVADATNETGEKIITTGVNLGGVGLQGGAYLLQRGAEGFFGVANKTAAEGTGALKTLVEGVVGVVDTSVEGSTKVVNRAAGGVTRIAGTVVDGAGEVVDRFVDNSTNVVDRTAKGVSQIGRTAVEGFGGFVDETINQGTKVSATAAKGLNLTGPLFIKATTNNLKVAIEELTDTGVVAVNNIDDFLDRARITDRVRATAQIMSRAANESGEFLVSRLNIPKDDVKEALEQMLVYGLDIGVKMSAAAGMAIYNIRQGLTMPVGSASSSASLTSADPENETRGPFTFNRQPPTGNTNQSLVPTNEETNRLKIVQKRLPPLPAPPIEIPVQQRLPALPAPPKQFPSQQLVPQTQNLSEEERIQQAKQVTEKKLTNLKDIMQSLTGNTGPITRSNEVLTPVMFNDFNNGDEYQEILLETYRRYKKNERRSASALKESPSKLWNDLKEDEQYLKTLGITPVGSFREPYEFVWSKRGIESKRDDLERMRDNIEQQLQQYRQTNPLEREIKKEKNWSSYFSWWTSHN